MIPRNDHFIVGFLAALSVAFIAFALLQQGADWLAESASRPINFKTRTLALMAICINVLPMNYFRRSYRQKSLRGLVTGTMVLALAWFFYFGRDLLNGG